MDQYRSMSLVGGNGAALRRRASMSSGSVSAGGPDDGSRPCARRRLHLPRRPLPPHPAAAVRPFLPLPPLPAPAPPPVPAPPPPPPRPPPTPPPPPHHPPPP